MISIIKDLFLPTARGPYRVSEEEQYNLVLLIKLKLCKKKITKTSTITNKKFQKLHTGCPFNSRSDHSPFKYMDT